MNMKKFMINDNKPSKQYRLYCPQSVTDVSGTGFDKFEERFNKCEENTIEHLIKIGEMMEWYQIVDIRNGFKVVKENAPIN